MSSELTGVVLDDYLEITLSELCEACGASAEHIRMLVAEGVIEPRGPGPEDWRFQSLTITRVRRAQRLERDLGVNLAGAALALDLMDEIQRLQVRLRRFEAGC
jgi:chaperone modulatory protein CbpM